MSDIDDNENNLEELTENDIISEINRLCGYMVTKLYELYREYKIDIIDFINHTSNLKNIVSFVKETFTK